MAGVQIPLTLKSSALGMMTSLAPLSLLDEVTRSAQIGGDGDPDPLSPWEKWPHLTAVGCGHRDTGFPEGL